MTVCRNDGRYDASNVLFADGRIHIYDKARPVPKMRHIVKPLDGNALHRACGETAAILTCEEHQKGDFGNIIAGTLCTLKQMDDPFVFAMMGIEDRFGESGRPRELMIRFGLTAEHIAVRARELVDRKGGGKKTRRRRA